MPNIIHWSQYNGPLYCDHCVEIHEDVRVWADCQLTVHDKLPDAQPAMQQAEYTFDAKKMLEAKVFEVLCDANDPDPDTTFEELVTSQQVSSLQKLLDAWSQKNKINYWVKQPDVVVNLKGLAQDIFDNWRRQLLERLQVNEDDT